MTDSQNLQQFVNLLCLTHTMKKTLASSDADLLCPDEKASILAILTNACAGAEAVVSREAHAEYGNT